jgi:hypothetical protein
MSGQVRRATGVIGRVLGVLLQFVAVLAGTAVVFFGVVLGANVVFRVLGGNGDVVPQSETVEDDPYADILDLRRTASLEAFREARARRAQELTAWYMWKDQEPPLDRPHEEWLRWLAAEPVVSLLEPDFPCDACEGLQ